MPTYKDEKTGTWYCKFYYTDYTGTRRQKKKRGFALQRDAKAWERSFLERQQGQPDMTMENLVKLYFEDMEGRLKPSTIYAKENRINVHILPYFGQLPVNSIKPAQIRKWQSELMQKTGLTGEPLSPTYLNVLHHTLSGLFNYAVKYYGLQINPCLVAGSIGRSKSKSMDFWTLEEYKTFISVVDNPVHKVAYEMLYYTGMRVGELLALTFDGDIDLDNGIVHITKTVKRMHGEDVVMEPKTPKSRRDVLLPAFLVEELRDYFKKIYEPEPDDTVFPILRASILYNLNQYAKRSGVKKIRIHDLRHSHAALLVELGFNPLLIAERLGHESIKTTLEVYSHLYPNKQIELIEKLDTIVPN